MAEASGVPPTFGPEPGVPYSLVWTRLASGVNGEGTGLFPFCRIILVVEKLAAAGPKPKGDIASEGMTTKEKARQNKKRMIEAFNQVVGCSVEL